MVDPVSGSGAELVRQMAEQAGAGDEATDGVPGANESQASDGFDAAMDGAGGAGSVESTRGVDDVDATDEVESATGVGRADDLEETGLRMFMNELGDDRERLDAMLEKCRSGGDMDQRELLELQGLIYGYSQRVEIATKVADKAAGGLKQMMNVRV
jgi:hypothetical protein